MTIEFKKYSFIECAVNIDSPTEESTALLENMHLLEEP
jgi:hypothetical protein